MKTSKNALALCSVYKDCTDGSYEACLHHEGFYELKRLELANVDNKESEGKEVEVSGVLQQLIDEGALFKEGSDEVSGGHACIQG